MRLLLFTALLWAAPVAATAQGPSAPPDPLKHLPQDTIVAFVEGETIRLSDLDTYSRTRIPRSSSS